MAINMTCTVSKCTNRIDEHALSAAGLHFINTLWVAAVRAGTTTKCLPHYEDTDIPTTVAAYNGSPVKRNRDKA